MRVILQMFGFRFEESVSSTLPLSLVPLSASAKLVPARCADLCQQFRLPGSVSSLFPFTYPCSLVISVDRHAVCCRHGIGMCVCVCVKYPSVCTIHLWTAHTLFLSLCPAMNNIPCLFNVNLAQLHPREAAQVPGIAQTNIFRPYIHDKLSPD